MFFFDFSYCVFKVVFDNGFFIFNIVFEVFFDFKYDVCLVVIEFFGNGYEVVVDVNFFDERYFK